MEFWLCLFLASPALVGLVGFAVWLLNYHLDRKASRFNLMFWHQSDQLGNYPIFYDPRTGHLVAVEPGNPAYPIQQTFLPPAATAPRPAPPAALVERPLVINYGRPAPAPAPEPTLNSGIEPERLPEPVQVELTIEEQMATAKREGRPKAATIEALTGAKKGGGESYRYWSSVWQSLPGPQGLESENGNV